MVKDDNGVWRCVHIINRINGDYLLKHVKAQAKSVETSKRITENVMIAASLTEEQRDALFKQNIKNNWKRALVKQYCTPKQIRAQIAQLRKDGLLP